MKKLNEKNMTAQEKRIPELAENAVKQARARTLKAGRSVVEAVGGKLIETHPDGSVKEIRSLVPPTQVSPDKRKIRRVK